ncbi:MAG TPA: DNA alkylation repair protein [Bacteroidales bacterium]|nr:DNA alkylation repair protein [Bacteroidales bacterium]
MKNQYLKPLIDYFEASYDAENAQAMAHYMKDHFEFYGIKSEYRKLICKNFLSEYGLPDIHDTENLVRDLWKYDEREYQYFAIEILDKQINAVSAETIRMLEFMIINKSWWDTVDLIASHLVGSLFMHYPELIKPYTEKWVESDNIWLKRTALLYQLKYKEKTNKTLLFNMILKLRNEEEFFIQKAIGWILREYSKTDPRSVKDFVKKSSLPPLSEREALKIINKSLVKKISA